MKNIIFLSLILSLAGCAGNKNADEALSAPENTNSVTLTDAQIKNAGIVTGEVTRKEISTILKLNGIVDVPPQNMVSISAPLGGYLKSTTLLPGMHITKGDVIAVMEDQQYIQLQQDYLTAKAKNWLFWRVSITVKKI
jgi:cobalt-zinc-cadmium efflux system membrane fusion protein